jgi:hypothetical protein
MCEGAHRSWASGDKKERWLSDGVREERMDAGVVVAA